LIGSLSMASWERLREVDSTACLDEDLVLGVGWVCGGKVDGCVVRRTAGGRVDLGTRRKFDLVTGGGGGWVREGWGEAILGGVDVVDLGTAGKLALG